MEDVLGNEQFQLWANDILVWIGFGTLVGLLAKAIMPGRDPGGSVATILMGIGGTIMGCGVWSFFSTGQRVIPVSPLGMVLGIAGTLLILFFYKLLSGYYFVEGEYLTRAHRRRRRPSRQRYNSAVYED